VTGRVTSLLVSIRAFDHIGIGIVRMTPSSVDVLCASLGELCLYGENDNS
jgi:hypothetical protein